MHKPLVTVITPTTIDREAFNEVCERLIQAQDYPNVQYIFDYDDGTIGEKRNRLCAQASGEIIVHFDSDDWYAPDWISRSVAALQNCDCTGLNRAYFEDEANNRKWLWEYDYKKLGQQAAVAGATLAYWKRVWERNPFPDFNIGEERQFMANAGILQPHEYIDGFIAKIHNANTISHKQTKWMARVM